MSNLSKIPELISIELKEVNEELALVCVNDAFQVRDGNVDQLIAKIDSNYYNTDDKIHIKYCDNGGRSIGFISSNRAVSDAYEIVKLYFKRLNVKTIVLYPNETSYGRCLIGTFPLIATICKELDIEIIAVVQSPLLLFQREKYLPVFHELKEHTDNIIQFNLLHQLNNPLFGGYGDTIIFYNILVDSVAKLIYKNSKKDAISMKGLSGDIVDYPNVEFKINNDLFIDIFVSE